MYVLVAMADASLTRNITAHRKKNELQGEKGVTLICFEHDHHRDAIMCNVPFQHFQGN